MKQYYQLAVSLLKQLIQIPAVSRNEAARADFLEHFLKEQSLEVHRVGNNLWCSAWEMQAGKPTILLNSHIDTVPAIDSWTRDPFLPVEEDGRLYGLGSNDAGAPLCSLVATFLALRNGVTASLSDASSKLCREAAAMLCHDVPSVAILEDADSLNDADSRSHSRSECEREQSYNLILGLSCQEEVTGAEGIDLLLSNLPPIDLAIVGEPTSMRVAVAEKGLMVLDCTAHGVSGHAAHNTGENAIYKAMKDIEWFRKTTLPGVSPLLGPVRMSVTMINAGSKHNIIPDSCQFTVDVRVNECYRNQELCEYIQSQVDCSVKARSFRLASSGIDLNHPLVQRCREIGLELFGSPTLSDQSRMAFPSVKLGPGDSLRSHTADEYVLLSDLAHAIPTYIELLDGLKV